MKKELFVEGIMALNTAFPNIRINVDFYWSMLSDLIDKEYIIAINKIVKGTRELYPNTNLVALIREKAKEEDKKLPGEAWQEVLGEISRIGSWGRPKFSDILIEKSVDAIGWKYICMSTNIMVERAHFFKVYETYINRDKSDKVIGTNNLLTFKTKKIIQDIANKKDVSL